jgi:hypothetical protein
MPEVAEMATPCFEDTARLGWKVFAVIVPVPPTEPNQSSEGSRYPVLPADQVPADGGVVSRITE